MPMLSERKDGHDVYKNGEGAMDLVASHQRSLIAAVMRTKGPILELGCGWYSSPLLHEIAAATGRPLVTIDNNKDWLEQFRATDWPKEYGLERDGHKLILVGWWGDAPFDLYPRWGLCFVDQSQPAEREYAVRRLMDAVDVFVMHDTEEGPAYGYNRVLPMFKYRWDDKCQRAYTSIVSNVIDVSKWGMVELPKVKPATEVT